MKLHKLKTVFFVAGLIASYQVWSMKHEGEGWEPVAPEYLSQVTDYIKNLQPNLEEDIEKIAQKFIPLRNFLSGEYNIRGIYTVHTFFTAMINQKCPELKDFGRWVPARSNENLNNLLPQEINLLSEIENLFIKRLFHDRSAHIIFLLGISHCKYRPFDVANNTQYTLKEKEILIKNFIKNFKEITKNQKPLILNFDLLKTNKDIADYINILGSDNCKTYLAKIIEIRQNEEAQNTGEKIRIILVKFGILTAILASLGVYFWQDIKNISTKAKTWWNKK